MDIIKILYSYENDFSNKNKEDLCNEFKFPIEFLENKKIISNNIINDLELREYKNISNINGDNIDISNVDISNVDISNVDISNSYKSNLYYNIFNPNNDYEKKIINKWSNYYTNDVDYLRDTQILIKNYKSNIRFNIEEEKVDKIDDLEDNNDNIRLNYEDIIYKSDFVYQYQYIDLPYFDKLNNNSKCMQILSIYNIGSPFFSLIMPIICLIMPYFIIKLQGLKVTMSMYIEHLKHLFKNHVIGQLFSSFAETSISTKIYIIFSLLFYLFQIYQNIFSCIQYFKNFKYINNSLLEIRKYIEKSIKSMKNILKYSNNLITYKGFNNSLEYNISILSNYYDNIKFITNYELKFKKFSEVGNIMKYFYKLYSDKLLIKALYFSMDTNGYIKNILAIQDHIKVNNINFCKFIKNDEKTEFKNLYYPELLKYVNDSSKNESKLIKNNLKLNNNLVLTGPNAAGKTTILKSTLFNILLCQQIGCGFFDEANVKIYDYIHCYINIPDTSGRDSLFQAEARQCKNILSIIEENKDNSHLCIFDELFSGTNPEEAVESAYGYLKHINNNNNVNYILTTHYYKLCKKLEKLENENNNKTIKNYHLEIKKKDDNFEFTYRLKKGISKIKGGIKVLKDLEYPEEIIKSIVK
jgi:hypothetical protein